MYVLCIQQDDSPGPEHSFRPRGSTIPLLGLTKMFAVPLSQAAYVERAQELPNHSDLLLLFAITKDQDQTVLREKSPPGYHEF